MAVCKLNMLPLPSMANEDQMTFTNQGKYHLCSITELKKNHKINHKFGTTIYIIYKLHIDIYMVYVYTHIYI